MTETILDGHFNDMAADPDSETKRASYYGCLASTELFVALEREAGAGFEPKLVELDGTQYAMVFDLQERMAMFFDAETSFVAMSGRALATSLAGQNIGLGLNLGVTETANLIGVEALDWLRERIEGEVRAGSSKVRKIEAPVFDNVELLRAIDARLAVFAGAGRRAYLVRATLDREKTHLMVLVGIPEHLRSPIAGGLAEALRFLAPDLALDTVFLDADETLADAASRVGLVFDMTPDVQPAKTIAAPGSDPSKPPKLH